MSTKSILYLGGFELPDKNAAAQRVISNAKLLSEMGYEVKLVGVAKSQHEQSFIFNGFSCHCLKYPETIREWLYHIITFLPFSEVKKYNPDVIILYNFPAIAGKKILRYCQRKHIKVIHDLTEWEQTDGWSPRDIVKRVDTFLRMNVIMWRMDGVIAISKWLYDHYRNKVKCVFVPPTVDLNDPKWNRKRELRSNHPITLVYAGSPGGVVKDRLDLIVKEVSKYQSIKLLVVGINEDQYYSGFNVRREQLKNVVFKGRLQHFDAVKAVCEADFQMLIRDKSRKNDAGFPTKLVESFACGTPVISTVFSNIKDYVKDGVNGFLVKEGQTLSSVIKQVSCLKPENIVEMKKNCIDNKVFDYHYYQPEFNELFD